MTEDEKKVAEAMAKCADVRLPKNFADRLVTRIRETGEEKDGCPFGKPIFTRLALVAASLTLLLGFVPAVCERDAPTSGARVALRDEIRPAKGVPRPDGELNGWAFFGLCREAIRRRVRPLFERIRKREDD